MPFKQGHALLIGVGTHKSIPNIDVPITKADAEAVATILQDANTCGYPAAQVKFIHDEGATKAGILAELDALAKRAGEQDTIFLFYAGHGALGTDGNYYFVSHDAELEDKRVVPQTGVSEAELLDKLRALKAQRVLMIFNACHSGNLSQSLDLEEPVALDTSSLSEDTTAALLGTGKGRIIITACGETQKSYFFPKDPNTIFTKALVEALRGKGVSNSRGFISAFSLYEHLFEAVSEFVQEKLTKQQEPELTVLKGVGPFAVALYRGAAALGDFDESETVPQGMAVREVKPEKSQRIFNQRVQQSGGVNFGQNNRVNIKGNVAGRDNVNIDARESKGFINQPQGPVNQHYGDQIDTGGGAYVGGKVNTGGGDFVGRDKTVRGDVVHGDKVGGDKVAGDKVGGDKVTGDKISVGNISGSSGVAIGRGAQANVNTAQAKPKASKADFVQHIRKVRTKLDTVDLPEDGRGEVQQNLTNLEKHLAQPEPKLTSITRWLNNINSVLKDTAEASRDIDALANLVDDAVDMAQLLFG